MKRVLSVMMAITFVALSAACKTALDEVPLSDKADTTAPTQAVLQMLSDGEFKPITKATEIALPNPYAEDDRRIHLRVFAQDPEGLGRVELTIKYEYVKFNGADVRDPAAPWQKCDDRDGDPASTNDDLYLFPKDLVNFAFDIKPRDDGAGNMIVATTLTDPFNVVDIPSPVCFTDQDLKRCAPDFKSGCYIGDPLEPLNLRMTMQLVVTNRSKGQTMSEKLVANGRQG